MEKSSLATQLAWGIETLLSLVFTVRLWSTGLSSKYRWLFFLFSYSVIRYPLLLAARSYNLTAYGWAWLASEAVLCALYACAILEIYTLVLVRYPAIRTFSRWVTSVFALFSVSIAVATLYVEASARHEFGTLVLFYMAERGFISSMMLLILMISAFLLWFPVTLPRNVVYHSVVFTVYFLAKALVLVFRNMLPAPYFTAIDLSLLGMSICVLLAWVVLLKPSGEGEAMVMGHRWNPAEEQRLLGQLRGINAALTRAGQR